MNLRCTVPAAAAAALAALAACGSSPAPAAAPAPTPTVRPLRAAVQTCDLTASAYADLGDDDRTLTLDGAGAEDTGGLTIVQIACVLAALHVTQAVASHMDATRALDGMQSDEWPGYTARWTYHPDAGFDVTVQDGDAS